MHFLIPDQVKTENLPYEEESWAEVVKQNQSQVWQHNPGVCQQSIYNPQRTFRDWLHLFTSFYVCKKKRFEVTGWEN